MAERGNEFLLEVHTKFKELLESPWSKIKQYIDDSGVATQQIIYEGAYYLLNMQTIYCVLGSRQKQLDRDQPGKYINAADYYSVWWLHAFYGPAKYWNPINHLND